MRYILLFIIIIFLISFSCKNFYKSEEGIYYTSRDNKTADLISVLRSISYSVADKIPKKDRNVIKSSLKFTTFKELIGDSPRILAWNYDKGREIAIRIYDSNGNVYSAEKIIDSLFHELAHTLTKSMGHGYKFQQKEALLKKHKQLYVNLLINNTFVDK